MKPLVLCIPIFDDWEAVLRLLREIDDRLSERHGPVGVLLVDDASTQSADPNITGNSYTRIRSVEILRLRRNVGHQRAIAIGLCFLYSERDGRAVVVLDGDGEDTPEGLIELVEAYQADVAGQTDCAIFAERQRRSESMGFRIGYRLYKLAHRLLTGRAVKVGNFSILPWSHLHTLVVTWELWNHYAAAFFKSGLPRRTLPIPRGPRYAGRTKMNVVALVVHGLGAIAVFSDVVGVRLLLATSSILGLSVIGIAVVALLRLFTSVAIPDWATSSIGILGVTMFQAILVMVVLVFVTLQGRDSSKFVPIRDFRLFLGQDPDEDDAERD